jgi:hypothetical protein
MARNMDEKAPLLKNENPSQIDIESGGEFVVVFKLKLFGPREVLDLSKTLIKIQNFPVTFSRETL